MGVLVVVSVSPERARAAVEDLLGDTIAFSGATLNLRPYVTMPEANNDIISTTTRRGDRRLYVTTQEGVVFVVNEAPNGSTTPVSWFNFASAVQTATGRVMDGSDGQRGLQSLAFHPDVDQVGAPGYGKLYTTMLHRRPSNPNSAAYKYLGNSTNGGANSDGVLAEWTINPATGIVNPTSYRELFRVNMPNYDHPIKQAKFNPYARSGDEDYGLLYMTHGDSNNQDSAHDDPQDRGDVMGKMIRINPLQSGADRYTIPATNPFAASADPGTLKELYAYGFRNPHTFSFNPDANGDVRILVGDIGRSNVEEINLVRPGENYGWGKREGTFVHLQGNNYSSTPGVGNAGYIRGVAPLTPSEATVGIDAYGSRYVYPVAQYDHNGVGTTLGEDYTATSIASGFVIRNSSDPALNNQLVFGNFAFNHGDMYHTDFDAMRSAVTQLDPLDPLRDAPGELTQAVKYKLHLALDHDSNPNTPAQMDNDDNLNDLTGLFRTDFRVGEGVFGEMYLTTKSRIIYQVTNTLPRTGDYDRNGSVDGVDLQTWQEQFGQTGYQMRADGDGDGDVDGDDLLLWQRSLNAPTPESTSVPEPGAIPLAFLAAICSHAVARTRQTRRA